MDAAFFFGPVLIQITRLLQFAVCKVTFIPPRLSEPADEGALKESVERKGELTSQFNATSADVPLVIVNSYRAR